jgi:hypothetical protein
MMTGNVGVTVVNGDLHMTGDAAANDVAIVQTQQNGAVVSGSYYISGLNGTTINGRTGVSVSGITRDFLINMGGGGGSLRFGPDPTLSNPSNDKFIVPRDLNLDVLGGATIYAGPSSSASTTFYANGITVGRNTLLESHGLDDHYYLRGNFLGDVTIDSYAKDASMTMFNGFVAHDLIVQNHYTAMDISREVSLYKMNIGHDASIYSNSTFVDVNSVSVSDSLNIGGSGDREQVSLQNVTQNYLNINIPGYGADVYDRVDLKGVTVIYSAALTGGEANDRFDIQGNFGALIVNGGTGNDTVLMHNSNVGYLSVTESSLSNQHDVISLSYMNVGSYAYVYTGSGNDTVSIDHIGVNQRLAIDTSDGADNVSLDHCVADALFARLGAGDDFLGITDYSSFRSGTIDGGAGNNRLYKTGSVVFSTYYYSTNFYGVFFLLP